MSEQDSRLTGMAQGYVWRLAAFLGLAVLMTMILAPMGRVWWCQSGDWRPWSWDVWSRHNSQHFVDPYTLSHIQHGIGLYLVLLLIAPRWTAISRGWAVALVETTWEVVENTNWMIERYREVTISLDYYGDSILNSVSDYGACLGGVVLAARLPVWVSGLLLVGLEFISVVWIRDSLLLNILMLACPVEAIRQWQMIGAPGQ
jgi:hypothetical protein